MNGKSKAFAEVVAIIVVAIWGMTFISTKQLLALGLSPIEIFFIRFAIAYSGIFLFQILRGISGRGKMIWSCHNWKDEIMCILAGIFGGSLYFWTENTALTYTQASNVSFIVCTTPLVTALMYGTLTRKKPSGLLLLGSAAALSGIALIAFNGTERFELGLKGDLLAMGASITWAVYTIISTKLLLKYSADIVTRKVFFYGLISILPIILLKGDMAIFQVPKTPSLILNLLFLSLIASLGCYAVWNIVIKRLGAVKASNFIYLNPIFTLIGAILILDETMTGLAGLGCALTLLGVWLADRTD